MQQAESALAGFDGDVLMLYGDVPFVPTATMQAMIDRLGAADAPAVVVLAFEPDDALQYGRVITEGDRVVKMVEHKDATDAERAVRLCNSGLMAAKARDLFALLARVTDDNAAKEFYLVDIVNIANADGRRAVVRTDPADVAGINSRAELAAAEAQWQAFKRDEAMAGGVAEGARNRLVLVGYRNRPRRRSSPMSSSVPVRKSPTGSRSAASSSRGRPSVSAAKSAPLHASVRERFLAKRPRSAISSR